MSQGTRNSNQPDVETPDERATSKSTTRDEGPTGAVLEHQPFWPKLFSWVGKLVLTILAVAVLLTSLKLAIVAHAMLASSRSQPPPLYLSSAPHPEAKSDSIPLPWPEFPHSSPSRVRTSIINGVRTITDGWTTGAPAGNVLAYYRDQMIARGWRDVTEETYSVQPESHRGLDDADAEVFAAKYRKIIESTLVLTSGQWTMHIVAVPSRQRLENLVEIYAVAAPSLKHFTDSLQTTLASNASQPLEVLRNGNGQLYRTTVISRDQTTAESFRQELMALQAQGWRSLILLPAQGRHPGQFAWLVKGEAYMALSVSPLPGSDRCSVMLTQVTPESGSMGNKQSR